MTLLGRSAEGRKVTPPGSTYMSNDQFANYLSDLRSFRNTKPSGARPAPPSTVTRRDTQEMANMPSRASAAREFFQQADQQQRSASAASHHRSDSNPSFGSVSSRVNRQSTLPPQAPRARDSLRSSLTQPLKPSDVVATATYIERGSRWMEKEEAVSLREALEDMKMMEQDKDEARIFNAAQDEASELVWEHQNLGAVRPKGKYTEHLRRHSYAKVRTASVGPHPVELETGLARDIPRSVSNSSNESGLSYRSRVSSESSTQSRAISPDINDRNTPETAEVAPRDKPLKHYPRQPVSGRRRTSGKRNISGEIGTTFSVDQIYEEPAEVQPLSEDTEANTQDPPPLRVKGKNPLNRVQFESPQRSNSAPTPSAKLATVEIHRNPPTQSRNAEYTVNLDLATPDPEAELPMRDGKEIRSDDIRKATSMSLKDRSPRLPMPTAISMKPGRPIVSFDANWKPPPEADQTPEEPSSARQQDKPTEEVSRGPVAGKFQQTSQELSSVPAMKTKSGHYIPSALRPGYSAAAPPRPPNNSTDVTNSVSPIPAPELSSAPPIPIINIPDTAPESSSNHSSTRPPIPKITLPNETPTVPTIVTPDVPSISISEPSAPQIANRQRPLPDPRGASNRQPASPWQRGHFFRAVGSRATVKCHQCNFPIEGKIVAVQGLEGRFHPECLSCFVCGTSLEAMEISTEPEPHREARLARIRQRARGEILDEIPGETAAEDGDTRLRFFCHLDWHELFAPRCKHCQTPIIGEHIVALGEHWHKGHFFCAECGDPFDGTRSHIEKDGYAWCLSCQTKRTERRAPKCTGCKKPVIGVYTVAMGGEWHEDCFCCVQCGDGFRDGKIFPKEVNGVALPVCLRCMQMEWKA